MKISELLAQMHKLNHADEAMKRYTQSKDSVKIGSPDREVSRVAVTMIATVDAIQEAIAWGAQLLITHEPIFGNDEETIAHDDLVGNAKKKLIENSGLTIYRYHDHPHEMPEDMIDCGTIRFSGLKGTNLGKLFWAVTGFALDEPMTAREIAATLERNLGTSHIQIAGAPDVPGRGIAFACGTPGHIEDALKLPQVDFVITGEISTFPTAEYARDQAQLGGGKAILVLGHAVSECSGMRVLAEILAQNPMLLVRYIPNGDLYSYTD